MAVGSNKCVSPLFRWLFLGKLVTVIGQKATTKGSARAIQLYSSAVHPSRVTYRRISNQRMGPCLCVRFIISSCPVGWVDVIVSSSFRLWAHLNKSSTARFGPEPLQVKLLLSLISMSVYDYEANLRMGLI